jgi:hypothetical protein
MADGSAKQTGFGREKSESLAGKHESRSRALMGCSQYLAGLSDKEIEDKVTTLVKSE